jgi:heptosyltransferase III
MKSAIFSCKGLGDGLICIALANNLSLNDFKVDIFHNTLIEMSCFFKNFFIKKYPDILEIDQILSSYDQIFISYDESSSFIMQLIQKGKRKYEDKIYVLNPSPSKKIGSQPYYSDALFDPDVSMVDNIDFFCRKILKLNSTTKKINYTMPSDLVHKKYKNRVVIHPSSAKDSKNWTKEKYLELAILLKHKNFEPVFVLSEKEKNQFLIFEEKGFFLKSFDNLKDLTFFIYESSYMIGNDSGIGHLCSMLDIPTISIFRNYRSAKLWRPGWYRNIIIYPNRLIPNLSTYRLRDRHWKKFISSRKVFKIFFKHFLQNVQNLR